MLRKLALAIVLIGLSFRADSINAQWEPPSNYYDNATGTGATLKSQLRSAMSAGHIQRRYGDFRFSAFIHDQDPDNSNNILLVYDGDSVDADWDSGATWNREHVWPQSRQPGSASNSSTGNLGDPHALRPATPSINSSRGNKPFGSPTTTGSFSNLGSFWFPGDACKGDIARSLFYSDTRWSSQGLSLVNGVPNGNQMGDLESLIAWHYLDSPDEFERRRNHTIFSSDFNPDYFTNNRNAFIDRPEFVWSVFVDQQNDSMISLPDGDTKPNGSSYLLLDFGKIITGSTLSTTQAVTVGKTGVDGTYYSIEPFLNADSNLVGRYNAFRISATDARTFSVSLQHNPNVADEYVGTVMVDNLDVTTQGGNGRGANDSNDFIDLVLKVVEPANASFDATTDQNTLKFELGDITLGQPITPLDFTISNLSSVAGSELTASLDFVASVATPATTFLSVAGGFAELPADQFAGFQIEGTPSQLGLGSTEFDLLLSDEDIPGGRDQLLEIVVNYNVVSGFILGDVNQDGTADLLDVQPFVDLLNSGQFQSEADVNQDGLVNLLDITPFVVLLAG